eukprot:TRINITY_DN8004_c0_g1_i1.p1 TRINITY_DN8004_c0_g1~~TRINITY_DN8004_c0_g1_i1.p1  ORF type:complete len:593 (+),score=200.21 TRINITY_DN8004_c0_g1_i1:51-1781(+)
MGVQGLKRLLQDKFSKSSHHVNPRSERAEFDHVYVDMNSVIHGCVSGKDMRGTLADVVATMDQLLRTVIPTKTLVITVDGPAPLAKIPLQRGRRRQSALTVQKSQNIVTKLDITPGSMFMAYLTSTLTAWGARYMAASPHGDNLTVVVSGDNVAGEGESKLFEHIQETIKKSCDASGNDATNEQFCIVGNDTDLVLGAVCMTRALNFTIFDSQSGDAFCIGDLLCCWIGNVAGLPLKHFIRDTTHLAPARLAFAFTQMFAGNDYLPPAQGIEASSLWGAVAENYQATPSICDIIDTSNFSLDPPALSRLLSAALVLKGRTQPTGREDTTHVQQYLQGLMWCLAGISGFGCPDYGFVYPGSEAGPHICAIITWCNQNKRPVKAPQSSVKPPPPGKYLACVLPVEAWWLISDDLHKAVVSDIGKKRKRQGETELDTAVARLRLASEPTEITEAVSVILKKCGADSSSRMQFGLANVVKKDPKAPKVGKLPTLRPPVLAPKMVAQDWQGLAVTQRHAEPIRPYFPASQPSTQMTNTNPFTQFTLDIPQPKGSTGKRKKKADAPKTGVQIAACLSMDEEV